MFCHKKLAQPPSHPPLNSLQKSEELKFATESRLPPPKNTCGALPQKTGNVYRDFATKNRKHIRGLWKMILGLYPGTLPGLCQTLEESWEYKLGPPPNSPNNQLIEEIEEI